MILQASQTFISTMVTVNYFFFFGKPKPKTIFHSFTNILPKENCLFCGVCVLMKVSYLYPILNSGMNMFHFFFCFFWKNSKKIVARWQKDRLYWKFFWLQFLTEGQNVQGTFERYFIFSVCDNLLEFIKNIDKI